MTTEWKEYTGSDEQISEIRESCRVAGFTYRMRTMDGRICDQVYAQFDLSFLKHNRKPAQYLICEKHPLMHMIDTQARTGQPVWIRLSTPTKFILQDFPTTKPDWNITGAEYSFQPFEELL